MAEIIEMPKLSDTMTEGVVVKWNVKEGDSVELGDVVAQIETDKATMDLEAFDSGTVLKIIVPEGKTAPCGAPILVLGAEGETFDISSLPGSPQKSTSSTPSDSEAPPAPQPEPAEASNPSANLPHSTPAPSGRLKVSPLARKLAAAQGIDLTKIVGTGPHGRIVKRDIEQAMQAGPRESWGFTAPGGIARDERIPTTSMRRTIAKRLVESKTQLPHFYVEIEVDAAPLASLRAAVNEALASSASPLKLSVNDFILKAVTEALRRVPVLNSTWEEDAIRQFSSVNLAFAVSVPGGLITPVIRDAQTKSVRAIGLEAKALAAKAKEGKLQPAEYTGGTFTVSNMGMLGVTRFYPIINPPQAAILGVGAALPTPVVNEHGQLVPGQRMVLTLSADHRVVDGADAARFLAETKRFLEAPGLLLL